MFRMSSHILKAASVWLWNADKSFFNIVRALILLSLLAAAHEGGSRGSSLQFRPPQRSDHSRTKEKNR